MTYIIDLCILFASLVGAAFSFRVLFAILSGEKPEID